ncbi:hypothetical protein [Rufibacter roseus]|uniref:Uncharacterized protein n=1 Tax=Rufibacter roseus TaxID=1567108 RepID=A0ABW2DMW7_9BACT|nr:hypothetical protein [Rufibacter roseus]
MIYGIAIRYKIPLFNPLAIVSPSSPLDASTEALHIAHCASAEVEMKQNNSNSPKLANQTLYFLFIILTQ